MLRNQATCTLTLNILCSVSCYSLLKCCYWARHLYQSAFTYVVLLDVQLHLLSTVQPLLNSVLPQLVKLSISYTLSSHFCFLSYHLLVAHHSRLLAAHHSSLLAVLPLLLSVHALLLAVQSHLLDVHSVKSFLFYVLPHLLTFQHLLLVVQLLPWLTSYLNTQSLSSLCCSPSDLSCSLSYPCLPTWGRGG